MDLVPNEHSALAASHGNSSGSQGGSSGRGGHSIRGGGRSGSRERKKCTHYGHNNHFVDYCWDFHCKPTAANQAVAQDDSTPASTSSTLSTTV
jgi:hypothetical protein